MGFMDELKKLTQPYEEEDDFFEGADVSFKPQPKAEAQPKTGTPQMVFESTFADEAPAPESQPAKGSEGGGFLGNLGLYTGIYDDLFAFFDGLFLNRGRFCLYICLFTLYPYSFLFGCYGGLLSLIDQI